jgi:hypothetical protein
MGLKRPVYAYLIVILWSAATAAHATDWSKALLGDAFPVRYICDYDRVATPEGVKKTSNFTLVFSRLGDQASLQGNTGSSPVFVQDGEFGGQDFVTFVEPTAVGNFTMTSVINKTGESVHSRHMALPGKSGELSFVPSQYYGKCRVLHGMPSE